MISEIISESYCLTNEKADNWEDAIRKAGGVLLENGCCSQEYVDDMVNVVVEHGPYIVIIPGVALAHARPECGAKKIGVSVVTLAEPVNFGNPDNDPVKLVLGLSAVDNNTHIEVIRDMMKILSPESQEKIFACKTPKELLEHLKQF